jgi:hypothetical protein
MSIAFHGGRAAALLLLLSPAAALACSACGCTLTSDWVGEGLSAQPGLRAELRYDYIPQTDLRSGTHRVDRGSIALPTDREIEQHTYNHYVTAGLDWSQGDWGVTVQAPFLSRPHDTIAEGDTDISHSHTNGLGDLRVTGRWQGFGGSGVTGVQLGLKLPTGGFHQTFQSGPQAGEPVDRGLQAGTGTTDLLLGLYHFGALAGGFDWFAQVNAAIPLNTREDYRPGNAALAAAGVRYTAWSGVTPQLQLNLRVAAQDTGLQSDHDNSGGELLYLSPGLTARLSPRVRLFGFVQLPVYQRVIGYQLTPKVTASAGVQVRL